MRDSQIMCRFLSIRKDQRKKNLSILFFKCTQIPHTYSLSSYLYIVLLLTSIPLKKALLALHIYIYVYHLVKNLSIYEYIYIYIFLNVVSIYFYIYFSFFFVGFLSIHIQLIGISFSSIDQNKKKQSIKCISRYKKKKINHLLVFINRVRTYDQKTKHFYFSIFLIFQNSSLLLLFLLFFLLLIPFSIIQEYIILSNV